MAILEDFNSYTDGNLHGQGGWANTASKKFQVQGTTVQEGDKAVVMSGDLGLSINTTRTISDITEKGIYRMYMRRDTVDASSSHETRIFFREGTTDIFWGGFDGSSIYYQGGASGSLTILNSPEADTWYLIEIEIDPVNNTIRGRVNGNAWVADDLSETTPTINRIRLSAVLGSDAVVSHYYDNITFVPSVSVGERPELFITKNV